MMDVHYGYRFWILRTFLTMDKISSWNLPLFYDFTCDICENEKYVDFKFGARKNMSLLQSGSEFRTRRCFLRIRIGLYYHKHIFTLWKP